MTSKRSAEYKRRNMKRRTSKRSFEMVPDGIPSVEVVKTPVDGAAAIRERIREESVELTKRLTAFEFKFITQLFFGDQGVIGWKAMKVLRPHLTDKSATEEASQLYARIVKKIGEDGVHEIIGYTIQTARRTILGLMNAKYTREFIGRDNTITTGGTYPDFMAQAKGVELLFKDKGVGKENDRSQPLVVQLIQYNPPNFPQWPGGGRVGASIPVTTVPYAALPAAPVTVDLGDRNNERED